jgi:histidine triad (HIT) family protein
MATVFSRIISGELPAYKVAETDTCLAFLDVQPIAKGHVLCIPKAEVDNLFDLSEELYQDLTNFARYVAKGLIVSVPCMRIGVAVIGLEVPHAHIHLVPINTLEDMSFTKARLRFSSEEYAALAADIKAKISLVSEEV